MMAQQICVLVYASSIGVCQFTVNSTTIAKMVYENVYSSSIIITFLQSFIYHNFYFLSLMHSIDIYIMVCRSFQYKKFRSTNFGLKMLAMGACFCLLAIADELVALIRVVMLITIYGIYEDIESAVKFLKASNIFHLVKLCVFKVSYAIAVGRLAQLVRKQPVHSMALAANIDRKSRYTSLVAFVCVPLLMNVVFVGYDVTIFWRFFSLYVGEMIYGGESFGSDASDALSVRIFVFTANSFIQTISFFVLFPKIRESVSCKR